MMSPKVRLPLVEASMQLKTELGALLSDLCERYGESVVTNSGLHKRNGVCEIAL
jgi:hypothetical protein